MTELSLWNQILASSASTKPIVHKTIFLLGGSPDSQAAFINYCYPQDSDLYTHTKSLHNDIANGLSVGYTFMEYKNASNDVTEKIDIYTIDQFTDPFHYQRFINSILAKTNIEDVLIIPLLDWSVSPHLWILYLINWFKFLSSTLIELPDIDLVSNSQKIKTKFIKKSNSYLNSLSSEEILLPLDEGECDFPLGYNIVMVVIGEDAKPNWSQSIFDYQQQILRIIALKHGSPLVYLPYGNHNKATHANFLQVVSYALQISIGGSSINSKIEPVLQNDLLIPFGWDTWGKINTINSLSIQEISKQYQDLIMSNDLKLQETNVYTSDHFLNVYSDIVPVSHIKQKSQDPEITFNNTYNFNDLLSELFDVQNSLDVIPARASTPLKSNLLYNSNSSTPISSSKSEVLRRVRENKDIDDSMHSIQSDKSFNSGTSSPIKIGLNTNSGTQKRNLSDFFTDLMRTSSNS